MLISLVGLSHIQLPILPIGPGTSDNRRATVINKDKSGTLPLLNGAQVLAMPTPQGILFKDWQHWMVRGFDFDGTGFPDASVYGDVLYLDEDANSGSGVAFSHVVGTGVTGRKYYAGLLSDTDLGSRITDPTTSLVWDARLMGVFRILSPKRYSSSHFKMRVTFNGNGGTINSGAYSDGVFTNGGILTSDFGDFNIEGKFGRDGLLYGKGRY